MSGRRLGQGIPSSIGGVSNALEKTTAKHPTAKMFKENESRLGE